MLILTNLKLNIISTIKIIFLSEMESLNMAKLNLSSTKEKDETSKQIVSRSKLPDCSYEVNVSYNFLF